MKSILLCLFLCIGLIQCYSIVPESQFGLEPPTGVNEEEDGNTVKEELAEEVGVEFPSSTTKTDDDVLIQMCIDKFLMGEIQLPSTTIKTTPEPSTSSRSTPTTTKATPTVISSSHEELSPTTESDAESATTQSDASTSNVEEHPTTQSTIKSSDDFTTSVNEEATETTAKQPTTQAVSTTTTAGPAILFSCNFEHGWCGIEQDASFDHFNWTYTNQPTPSKETGPDQAYSGTHYIFMEASSPAAQNEKAAVSDEKAEFRLPVLPEPHGEVCLKFKYHMYGHHIRVLEAYVERSHDPQGVEVSHDGILVSRWQVFKAIGNQGNEWKHAEVSLFTEQSDRIGFLGVRGEAFSGDIAIDDIMVTSGFCNNQ